MSQEILKDNLDGKNHEGANTNWPVKFLTATSVIGDEVLSLEGEKLGHIKDIMLNVRKGIIEYVVVETSSFLGFNTKYFAIPFEELKLKASKKAFVLQHHESVLKNAPGFDKEHWPETNSHHYATTVDNYWGEFMGVNVGG